MERRSPPPLQRWLLLLLLLCASWLAGPPGSLSPPSFRGWAGPALLGGGRRAGRQKAGAATNKALIIGFITLPGGRGAEQCDVCLPPPRSPEPPPRRKRKDRAGRGSPSLSWSATHHPTTHNRPKELPGQL